MGKKIVSVVMVCLLGAVPPLATTGWAHPSSQQAAVAATAEKNNPAWLAALNLILPLGEKVLGWLFGPRDEKKLKRNEVETIIKSVLAQVRNQMNDVSQDIERINSWRELASEVDGRGPLANGGSIKDALKRLETLVAVVDGYSEPALLGAVKEIGELLVELHKQTASVIEDIYKKGTFGDERTLIASALSRLSLRLLAMRAAADKLAGQTDPAKLRDALRGLGSDLKVAIDACNDITIQHDLFQQRLARDFVAFMQKFDAQPPPEVLLRTSLSSPLFLRVGEAEQASREALENLAWTQAQWEQYQGSAASASASSSASGTAAASPSFGGAGAGTGADPRLNAARAFFEAARNDSEAAQRLLQETGRRLGELQAPADLKAAGVRLEAALAKLPPQT